jgi:hypothetical protein
MACQERSTPDTPTQPALPAPVATIVIEPASIALVVGPGGGTSRQLTAILRSASGGLLSERDVTWLSSASSVATVSATGTVMAVRAGSAVITATSEGRAASAMASVSEVPVASVIVGSVPARLYPADQAQLTVALADSAGRALTGRAVSWMSSDTTVLRVSPAGVLTAMRHGLAMVQARSESRSGAAEVRVWYDSAAVVRVDTNTVRLAVGSKDSDARQLVATATGLSGRALPAGCVRWSSSDSSIVRVTTTGLAQARRTGATTVRASCDARSASMVVIAVGAADTPVPVGLSTIDSRAQHIVPVLEIRILPTQDGMWLDSTRAPWFSSFNGQRLADLHHTIDSVDLRKKYALEEGSRFRGYKTQNPPSVTYRVERILTLYDSPPLTTTGIVGVRDNDGAIVPSIDYRRLFDQLGVMPLINSLGIKEVWIWQSSWSVVFPTYVNHPALFDVSTRYRVPESAMSSPRGECASNSFLEDCALLPKASHTYLVYGDAYTRGVSCALHNRGHQFEAMFSAVDRDGIFWPRFAGRENGQRRTGRAGDAHSPPNTTADYDYWNTSLVAADIEDWSPGGGTTRLLNADRWEALPYRYADDDNCGGRWLTYWMQAFPGRDHGLRHNGRAVENWWELYTNWDAWRAQGRSLVRAPAGMSAEAASRPFGPLVRAGIVHEARTDYPAPTKRR